MTSVEFHPEAEAEFISAARYYEDQAENLGLDFISSVQQTYQRILGYPESGRPFGRRLRRVLVPRYSLRPPLSRRTAATPHRGRGTSSPLAWLLAVSHLSEVLLNKLKLPAAGFRHAVRLRAIEPR